MKSIDYRVDYRKEKKKIEANYNKELASHKKILIPMGIGQIAIMIGLIAAGVNLLGLSLIIVPLCLLSGLWWEREYLSIYRDLKKSLYIAKMKYQNEVKTRSDYNPEPDDHWTWGVLVDD